MKLPLFAVAVWIAAAASSLGPSRVWAQAAPASAPVVVTTAAPATPVAADPPSDDYADTRKGFDGRLSLGASLRTLSASRVGAGAVQGSFGGQFHHVAVHGDVDFEHGRTGHGLATSRFRVGPSVEGIVDRLRLGGGFGLVYSSFRRATRPDSVGALALDLSAFALVDVVRFDGGAFVAGVRADLELLLGVQVGGSLQVGVRF